ncbi:hypothetical protein EMCRGX_G016309 [Ephydatia muelleri]
MWHYLWAHTVYHCTRCWVASGVDKWFTVALASIFSLCFILPHIWVLCIYDYYVLYCSGPMYSMTAVSLVFTLIMITFCSVFVFVDRIHTWLKILFHLFGLVDFVFGLFFISDSIFFRFCAPLTPVMYTLFDVFTAGTVVSTGQPTRCACSVY